MSKMTIKVELTKEEATSVRHALYVRLRELAAREDHDPDPHVRAEAMRLARPLLAAADKIAQFV